MSLEHALQENTIALNALTQALLNKELPTKKAAGVAPAAPVTPPAKAEATQTSEPTKAPPVEDAPTSTAKTEAFVLNEYEPLQKAILRLVAKDRARTIEIMAQYGAAKGPEIKSADWGACYCDFLEALGEPVPTQTELA